MKKIRVLFLSVKPAFLAAVISMLNADPFFLADSDFYENYNKRNKKYDVIVFNDNSVTLKEYSIIKEDLNTQPNTPKILYTSSVDKDYIELFSFGNIKGIVSQRAEITIIKEAVEKVLNGEIYFCRYIKSYLAGNSQSIKTLTQREKEILKLSQKGLKHKEIAKMLFIDKRTVDTHFQNIKGKLL